MATSFVYSSFAFYWDKDFYYVFCMIANLLCVFGMVHSKTKYNQNTWDANSKFDRYALAVASTITALASFVGVWLTLH